MSYEVHICTDSVLYRAYGHPAEYLTLPSAPARKPNQRYRQELEKILIPAGRCVLKQPTGWNQQSIKPNNEPP